MSEHNMIRARSIGLAAVIVLTTLATAPLRAADSGKQVPPDVAQVVERMGDAMAEAVLRASPQERSVAVLDFQNLGPDSSELKIGETMSDMLNTALVKSGKVVVIDRKNIRKVMEEIALGQSGVVDEATAAEAGNIVGASIIIAGTASHVGNIFVVTARAIDVKTAKVVGVSASRVPDEMLIGVAAQYYDLHRYPMNAVYRSIIMPGWGQFFNNQPTKGYVVLGSEAALLLGALGFHLAASSEFDNYHNDAPDSVSAGNRGDNLLLGRNITLGVAGGVWLYALTDSYLQTRKYNKRIYGASQEPRAKSGKKKSKKKKTSLRMAPLFAQDDISGITLVYSW